MAAKRTTLVYEIGKIVAVELFVKLVRCLYH